jgi:DMSO/TMAO reductase YedYZ molybdopterin-dependent catalytic subunit
MDLEGLITPTELHYTVQHFAVPPITESKAWSVNVSGEVKTPLTLNFEQLRRFPARSVRTVMECSGSARPISSTSRARARSRRAPRRG